MYIKVKNKNHNWKNFLDLCKEYGYRVWENINILEAGDYIFINKDVIPFIQVGTGKLITLYSSTNTEFGDNFLDLDNDWNKIVADYFSK